MLIYVHPRSAALLLVLLLMTTTVLTGQHTPLPTASCTSTAAVVSTSPARARYKSLDLGYSDFKRVLTRPLLHLEPDGLRAEHPRLYISSAFLGGGGGEGGG